MNNDLRPIAIITYHRAINYGALLQCYALQRTILNRGILCEVLDYRSHFIETTYAPLRFNPKRPLLSTMKILLQGSAVKKRIKTFRQFIQNHLTVSNQTYSLDNIVDANYAYSAFITGSDQVWSDECGGYDTAYFLTFVDDTSKKFSYAASFGFDRIPSELISEYKVRLQGFNLISMREQSGAAVVKDLLGREALVHADPAFLLSSGEWQLLASKAFLEYQNYILLYSVRVPVRLLHYALKLSRVTGLRILYINPPFEVKLRHPQIRCIDHASPEEFLTLFMHADYVLTNSYHGTAFSIIFHKQFAVEIENRYNRNVRASGLLKSFDLQDRMFPQTPSASFEIDNAPDWGAVDKTISELRQSSFAYFERIKIQIPQGDPSI